MKNLLIFLSFFIVLSATQKQIQAIEKTAVIVESSGVKLGDFALLVRKNTIDMIVKECLCVDKNEKSARFECKDLKQEQDALPYIEFEIEKDDFLVIDPLKNRVLIIAPNFDSYLTTSQEYKFSFVHPDLFVAHLLDKKNSKPTRQDFYDFCDEYYVSRLIFDFSSYRSVVGCKSFKELEKLPKTTAKNANKEQISPFFHRLGDVSFGILKSDVQNFDDYYKGLIYVNKR